MTEMTKDDDMVVKLSEADIKAIADEVVRRLLPFLKSPKPDETPYFDQVAVTEHVERLRQESREWIAEKERLDKEIRERSQEVPPRLRPHPEQYKSIQRKKHVLQLLEDPARWCEIPALPVQWGPRKKS